MPCTKPGEVRRKKSLAPWSFFGNLTKIHRDNSFCSGSFTISLSHPFSNLWSLHHQRVRLSRLGNFWSKGGMWRRRRRRRRRWRWPTTPWPGLQPPLVMSVASVGVSQKNFSMSTSFHDIHYHKLTINRFSEHFQKKNRIQLVGEIVPSKLTALTFMTCSELSSGDRHLISFAQIS